MLGYDYQNRQIGEQTIAVLFQSLQCPTGNRGSVVPLPPRGAGASDRRLLACASPPVRIVKGCLSFSWGKVPARSRLKSRRKIVHPMDLSRNGSGATVIE